MKILVATGHLAESTVRHAVGSDTSILTVDTEVAAFITPYRLIYSYKENNFKPGQFDMVLVPGLVPGDFTEVANKIGCPVCLGPKHAYDLGYAIRFAGNVQFSNKVPACELLKDIRQQEAYKKLGQMEKSAFAPLILNDTKIGGNSQMKVMGEIVDAGNMDRGYLQSKVAEFTSKGADIIDLGMAIDTPPENVHEAILNARKVTGLPLSVDTLDSGHIRSAIDAGIDMVLSLNDTNIDELGDEIAAKGCAVVIIPDSGSKYDTLVQNIKRAKEFGIENIIADPVLDPIGHGFTSSVERYRNFRDKYPDIPLFFGAGNVTELMDADSIGINATLCGIAHEVGAAILFTPEYSDKTQGSIAELKTASSMMKLAEERHSSPKDLGIDMLMVKEKRKRPDIDMPDDATAAKSNPSWQLDPAGAFHIGIAHINDGKRYIVAEHAKETIIGKNAAEILDMIIDKGLVTSLEHAGYLGRELEKAEIAIEFDRSYVQDDEF